MCPFSPDHPHHAREFRQQMPCRSRVLLEAFAVSRKWLVSTHDKHRQRCQLVSMHSDRTKSLGYGVPFILLQPTLPHSTQSKLLAYKVDTEKMPQRLSASQEVWLLSSHSTQLKKNELFSFTKLHTNPCHRIIE